MKTRISVPMFAFVLCAMFVWCQEGSSRSNDDGWRRTARGWERMLVSRNDSPSVEQSRLCRLHPLLLACWQAAAGIGGLMMGEGAVRRQPALSPAT